MAVNSNYARFLILLRILVDETTEEAPLTKAQILDRCAEEGAFFTSRLFDEYVKRCMKEGGIIIKRRLPEDLKRGEYLYWYDEGWI